MIHNRKGLTYVSNTTHNAMHHSVCNEFQSQCADILAIWARRRCISSTNGEAIFQAAYRRCAYEYTLKGSALHLFKSMLFVHCRISIDPESINRLIRNYALSKHEQSCKQMFIMMLSEIPNYDLPHMFKVSIMVDDHGNIQHVEVQPADKRLGTLIMDKQFFIKKIISLHMPGYVIKGGSR